MEQQGQRAGDVSRPDCASRNKVGEAEMNGEEDPTTGELLTDRTRRIMEASMMLVLLCQSGEVPTLHGNSLSQMAASGQSDSSSGGHGGGEVDREAHFEVGNE